jgi:hypothetical protein
LRDSVFKFLLQHHSVSFDISIELATLVTTHCAKINTKELQTLLPPIDSALRHHLNLSATTTAVQSVTIGAHETRTRQIRALLACTQLIRKVGSRANARTCPSLFQLVELLQSFHSATLGSSSASDAAE